MRFELRLLSGVCWGWIGAVLSRMSLGSPFCILAVIKNSVEVNRPTKQHQQKLLKVLQRDKRSIVEKEGETGRKKTLIPLSDSFWLRKSARFESRYLSPPYLIVLKPESGRSSRPCRVQFWMVARPFISSLQELSCFHVGDPSAVLLPRWPRPASFLWMAKEATWFYRVSVKGIKPWRRERGTGGGNKKRVLLVFSYIGEMLWGGLDRLSCGATNNLHLQSQKAATVRQRTQMSQRPGSSGMRSIDRSGLIGGDV